MSDTDVKVAEMKRYLNQENLDVLVDQIKQIFPKQVKHLFFTLVEKRLVCIHGIQIKTSMRN